ncbi:MAG: hydrolase 2, exosortase A system-associated [Halioglobus sp.]|nr:hydrolase 2, exosortase A system-associated [Halioglobus sp.]
MPVSVKPMFLDGENGRIFALHFCPEMDSIKAHIVFLPPFAEEMNRCRHLAADQARRFASMGFSCLIIDPFGTGDSEGELAQSSWRGWHADAMTGVQWCQQQRHLPVILWGLRLGAMLALDLAAKRTGQFSSLLLWQPVTNGKTFLTQILRARIAFLSGMEMPPETTGEMRSRLEDGENVEVAGYVLGGTLAKDIDNLSASGLTGLSGANIHWLQQASASAERPSSGVQKVVDQLISQDNKVDVTLFHSPQIWQLSERADCRQLLDKTSAIQLL